MTRFVGLDVSQKITAICVVDDAGSQMAGFWQSRFDHLEDLFKRMDQ
jgi:hypothetical protein